MAKESASHQKQKAHALIEESRREIAADFHLLQQRLKPRNMARTVLDRKPAVTLGTASLIGFLLALWLYKPRNHPSSESAASSPARSRKRQAPPGLMASVVKNAVSAGAPMVVKNLMAKFLTDPVPPSTPQNGAAT